MDFITGRAVGILLIVVVFGAIFGIPQLATLLARRDKKRVERDDDDDDDPPTMGGMAVPV